MRAPLVSIVVPYYKGKRYLYATLDCIYFQDYRNIEIILINDEAAAGSRRIISQYLNNVKKSANEFVVGHNADGSLLRISSLKYDVKRSFVLIQNRSNVGETASLNKAFGKANGKYVTYIVQDDLPHPSMISSMVNEIISKKADFVYSDMWLVNDNMEIVRAIKLPDYDFYNTFCRWYFAGVSKLFKKSLLKKFGCFDTQIESAMDYELFSRFAIKGAKFSHLKKVLYSVRHHGKGREVGQHSRSAMVRLFRESIEISKRNLNFYNGYK